MSSTVLPTTQTGWVETNLHLRDLSEISQFFVKPSDDFVTDAAKNVACKIQRVIHYLQTGVWINSHNIGQTLNAYRFSESVNENAIYKIENILNEQLGQNFTEKIYAAAEEETFSEWLRNSFGFFAQFVKSPETVGSIFPSSKRLAKAVVREISADRNPEVPVRILEVGPGTGIFSKKLIDKLEENDSLDLVEYDEKFVKILQKRFGHRKNVTIIQGDFTQFHAEHKYDYCVSGLPLAAFPKEMVEKVYQVFDEVVYGKLIYFEYKWIPNIKKKLLSEKKSKDFEEILSINKNYYNNHSGIKKSVWPNLTPANVCTVKVNVNHLN